MARGSSQTDDERSGAAGRPAPPTTSWSDPLLQSCRAEAGAGATYAEAPTELLAVEGAWAFSFSLAAAAAPWDGPLIVRLSPDRAGSEVEAAAIGCSRANGLDAPEVRLLTTLQTTEGNELAAVVHDEPSGLPLAELMAVNLTHGNELLGGFARHHARIHALPLDDLDAVPIVDIGNEIARIDGTKFAAQRRWLDAHQPAPGAQVLCHGAYQPGCVHGPPAELWPDLGGPGEGLTVSNWGNALRCERESDVAYTLLAFWSLPYFARTRSERAAMKMLRNNLINTYRVAYVEQQPLDADRLQFWQAFHCLRGLARMVGWYDVSGLAYQAIDRGPLPAELAPELQRHFIRLTGVR